MPSKLAAAALLALMAGGCASLQPEPVGPPRKETVFAVTEANALVRFNAGQPQNVTPVGAVTGLQAGESLLGIDFRVARGVLFALGSTGRIYTLDTQSAVARPVGSAPLAITLEGRHFGFDFNPTVDRIRIASDAGQNFRGHPDTGAAVDSDPNTPGVQGDGRLAYASGDANRGKAPRVVGAAYTYNKQNEKITTNYAIDAGTGALVMQGTKEGAAPTVSPNTGQLYTVGSLGVPPFSDVGFDIADVSGAAFAAINSEGSARTRFYLVDLATGKAAFIGTVGGARLRGISIEP